MASIYEQLVTLCNTYLTEVGVERLKLQKLMWDSVVDKGSIDHNGTHYMVEYQGLVVVPTNEATVIHNGDVVTKVPTDLGSRILTDSNYVDPQVRLKQILDVQDRVEKLKRYYEALRMVVNVWHT